MFDRQRAPVVANAALIVHIPPLSASATEFAALATASGATIVAAHTFPIRAPSASHILGKGQVAELAESVRTHSVDVVLINHRITPSQERNLQKALGCRIVDRVGLILDIFALRAATHESKLQVELAQLRHMATRLTRGWTHLERQRGGIGLRGPGETQLESDRRLVQQRIRQIEAGLKKVANRRELGRKARRRNRVPTVALVGYTNAGKSTLFNQLAASDGYVADQLFATLDTTLRQWKVVGMGTVVLADTVGFIQNLPHELVAAFRATLEEVREADVLLHVFDARDVAWPEYVEAVREVLTTLGADSVPEILIANKFDDDAPDAALAEQTLQAISSDTDTDTDTEDAPIMEGTAYVRPPPADALRVSARYGRGLHALKARIAECLEAEYQVVEMQLVNDYGALRAALFRMGEVLAERSAPDGAVYLTLRMTREARARIIGQAPPALVAVREVSFA